MKLNTNIEKLSGMELQGLYDFINSRVNIITLKKHGRKRVFNFNITFLLFLWQILSASRTCRETLRCAQVWFLMKEDKIISSNTSAYCQARARLSDEYIHSINSKLLDIIDSNKDNDYLWQGKRVKIVDGSSVSMPDTEDNQNLYPQPSGQKQGCGFPVMRITAMFSLESGALIAIRKGSLHVHERILFHKMWDCLSEDDVVLADRGFCSFGDYWMLSKKNVDCVMRLHQRRKKGVKRVEILGQNDCLVEWTKSSACPKWISKEAWNNAPDNLLVRHIIINNEIKGFRSKSFTIATTLLDSEKFPAESFSELYIKRWYAELFLRDIKTSMGMDILRCKTPSLIHKELAMFIVAYNFVRLLIYESALRKKISYHRISLTGAIATIRQWAPFLLLSAQKLLNYNFTNAFFDCIGNDILPIRPFRFYARAIKRRKKNYQLLTKPRDIFNEIPHRNKYKKP